MPWCTRRARSHFRLGHSWNRTSSSFPPHFPIKDKWADTSEHWLAVEILSRSSRVYDREFKRDAYLALGVREVWLVDKIGRSVEVSRVGVAQETVRDALLWHVPGHQVVVRVDLSEVFAGIA